MNVPLGSQVFAGKELSEELVRDIVSFMDSGKTGYFCITTEGSRGIEEGLLVIEAGNVIGAHYAYLAFGKEAVAGEALKRVLNSLLAPKGVYDAYTLTSQQLELLKIFNESVLLLERLPLRSFEGLVPVKYSADLERAEAQALEESRDDLLKRRGMSQITVDSYSELKSQVESLAAEAGGADLVAAQVDSYLSAGEPAVPEAKPMPAAPKPAPAPAPGAGTPASPASQDGELNNLNDQAEKLRKLLLKGK